MNAEETIRFTEVRRGVFAQFLTSYLTNPQRRKLFSELIRRLVWLFVLSAASYVITTHYVASAIGVSGSSMAPTINDSDFYFLNHLTYLWREPRRGDIVVIKDPIDGTYSIKRIVATSGDLLYLKDGHVYLNGNLLEETYLPHGTRTWAFSSSKRQVIRCRKNEVAVLGDNRDYSVDSRLYGPVSHKDIVGLVMR